MADYTLGEIAKLIQAKFTGDKNYVITGVATLQSANEKQISFLGNQKYAVFLTTTKAAAVILNQENSTQYSGNSLIVKNPRLAFAQIANLFIDTPQIADGIHNTAIIGKNCKIDPSAKIDANVVIGNNVTIGANTQIHSGCVISNDCQIGADCYIWPNVTIYYKTKIGNGVNIHSGTILGADGFGWEQHEGQWHKVPQLGCVIIKDNVDIGANTTIDRGTLDNTVIETGVKLDNLIQVGHNTKIGAHTVIAGCTAIAGSTTIGKHCTIGGNVAIADHLNIADHVILTGRAMITGSIKKSGIYSSGTGFMENRKWLKNAVRFQHLDEMAKKLKKTEKLLIENVTNSDL